MSIDLLSEEETAHVPYSSRVFWHRLAHNNAFLRFRSSQRECSTRSSFPISLTHAHTSATASAMSKDVVVVVQAPAPTTIFNRWFGIGLAGLGACGVGCVALWEPALLGANAHDSMLVRAAGGALVLGGLAAVAIVRSPRVLFVFSYTTTLLRNRMMGHNHWDEIVPELILGTLPQRHHIAQLTSDHKVTGVLALVEGHELQQSLCYEPATMEMWSSEGVQTKWVRTPDYEPVSPNMLVDAADWIHAHVRDAPDSRKVYCTCLSIHPMCTTSTRLHTHDLELVRTRIVVSLTRCRPLQSWTRQEHGSGGRVSTPPSQHDSRCGVGVHSLQATADSLELTPTERRVLGSQRRQEGQLRSHVDARLQSRINVLACLLIPILDPRFSVLELRSSVHQ